MMLDDPIILLFLLTVIIVLAGVVICVIAIFARNGHDAQERAERIATRIHYTARLSQCDEDYKALVESYLRETGKVYVRPARVENNGKLAPPQPNPFRMKPPSWAPTPKPKEKVETEL